MKTSQRNVIVLSSLVGVLTLTSALLLALAPPSLSPQAYNSLSASDRNDFLDQVFHTESAPQAGRWKYLFIHHSLTSAGDAQTLAQPNIGLADHFVVGNGNGCQDGEILISPRWNKQDAAAPSAGIDHIDDNCISICLVGDFDKATPTPTQLRRLAQLVSTLQSELRITGDHVIMMNQSGSACGIGRHFPSSVFRDQILP